MAFEQTDHCEPGTFQEAMFPECNHRILGTGRIKTATGGKKGGYQYLVKTDNDDNDLRKKFTDHS